ncbi:endonuclease/exonuclease/phosphatase family protein [Methanosarcina sp. Mfa9]|uniref:endonuclease/exonuclease/phosphatase family protein n=1 Tax=Methanosarcina sp. Mfa9 TaxID=3439063 RepID=UPI003F83DD82
MKLRIATFNLENLDFQKSNKEPTLEERIAVIRPQLERINADILCLQEIHGQEEEGQPRRLLALDSLLRDTRYAGFHRVSTMIGDGSEVCDKRNLVILSRYEIQEHHQYRHYYAPAPHYRLVMEEREEGEEQKTIKVTWERPILHARISVGDRILDVINLHLKSRLATNIKGQKLDRYTWKNASAWAEGFFLSSMKRVGQALETRMLIDQLFKKDEAAWIVVCGDFNADFDEVPVEAIRGQVENTGNGGLAKRVMLPCEMSIPESARFSLYHRGRGRMLDHLLVSRSMLAHYKGSEVHNELLHDESIAFATETKFPESDHAPVIAEFELPDID